MIFSDKIEKGKSVGRIFRPLLILTPTLGPDDNKIASLSISRRPLGDAVDQLDWLRLGSILTPFFNHAALTEWNRPNVRSSTRVTKTGPGGSSLALSNLSTADAARAAARAGTYKRRGGFESEKPQEPKTAQYVWSHGTVSEFKFRLPVAIEAIYEKSQEGLCLTWRIAKRPSNWISFNETTKQIHASAPSVDTLDQLIRIIRRIPGVVPVGSVAPALALKQPTEETAKLFKVINDFSAEEDIELSVQKDDVVVIFNEDDGSGWVGVKRVKDEAQGYVPTVYLTPTSP
jgi:hypothetical protein